jgi:hypothetical protein
MLYRVVHEQAGGALAIIDVAEQYAGIVELCGGKWNRFAKGYEVSRLQRRDIEALIDAGFLGHMADRRRFPDSEPVVFHPALDVEFWNRAEAVEFVGLPRRIAQPPKAQLALEFA